jgi:putative glutamine amidotransferase
MTLSSSANPNQPIIGLTTYAKKSQDTNVPLYGLMTSYVEAVTMAGGIPVLIPLNLTEDALRTLLARLDGFILPGGGDIDPLNYHGGAHPELRGIDRDRDRVEIFVAQQAAQSRKPLLAICRGHQVLNVALGGTMYEDIQSQLPGAIRHDFWNSGPRTDLPHEVAITPNSKLAEIIGRRSSPVNSLHHQGVRDIAPDLSVTAVAPDGLVEGLEIKDHPFGVAVQWHPENLIYNDPAMLALFSALVAASGNGHR